MVNEGRQAGEKIDNWIRITPEMIEAGVSVLVDEWGIVGDYSAPELAEEVFRRMLAKATDSAPSITNGASADEGGTGKGV